MVLYQRIRKEAIVVPNHKGGNRSIVKNIGRSFSHQRYANKWNTS